MKTYADFRTAIRFTSVLLTLLTCFVCINAEAQISQEETKDSWQREWEKMRTYLEGVPAPEFQAKDINGKTVRFSDFKGKTIVIDFWFTTCVPCLSSMAYYNSAVSFFKDSSNIVLLSVCIDKTKEKGRWKKVSREKNIQSINLFLDKDKAIANNRFYIDTIKSFPSYIIIGPNGKFLGNAESPYSLTSFTYIAYKATKGVSVIDSSKEYIFNKDESIRANWIEQRYDFFSVHDVNLRDAIKKYNSIKKE